MKLEEVSEEQRKKDDGQLKVLSILYWVLAAFQSLVLLVVIPIAFSLRAATSFHPLFWAVLGLAVFIVLSQVALNVFAALSISKRRHWIFVLVAAGVNCLHIPFGLAVGVVTFVILLKESVKAQFGE